MIVVSGTRASEPTSVSAVDRDIGGQGFELTSDPKDLRPLAWDVFREKLCARERLSLSSAREVGETHCWIASSYTCGPRGIPIEQNFLNCIQQMITTWVLHPPPLPPFPLETHHFGIVE